MNGSRSAADSIGLAPDQHSSRAESVFPSLTTSQTAALAIATVVALWIAIAVILTSMAQKEWSTLVGGIQTTSTTVSKLLAGLSDQLLVDADLVRHFAAEIVGPEGPLEVDRADHDALRRMIDLSPYIVSVWVGDAEGTAALTTREYPAPALSAADREYFTAVRDDPERLFVGNLIDNRYAAEALLINTSRRLSEPDGEMRGFIQVSLDPDPLSQIFQQVDLGYDASLWWIGPDGRPLMREPMIPAAQLEEGAPPGYQNWPLRKPDATDRAQDNSPVLGISGLDGEERLMFWSDASIHGSRIIVGVSYDELTSRWRTQLASSIWFGVLLGTVGTLVVWLLHRSRSRALAYTAQLEHDVGQRTDELAIALQQKNLMLTEIEHRVRNAFSTILALTRQMLQSSSTLEAFREEFPARLQTLARTQLMLVASKNQDHARIDDLAKNALAPYPLTDVQVEIAGPPADLSRDQAFGVGIILHELVTNAVKYGSLSVPDGAVALKWTLEADEINLVWQELRGPNVTQPGTFGSGSDVMDRAARMIGGALVRDFNPSGVRVRLTIPKRH